MKTVTIIGASHGVGAAMAAAFHAQDDKVTAVARDAGALRELAGRLPGITTLARDARDAGTATELLHAQPDVVILAAGTATPNTPFHELDWDRFSQNWNGDMQMTFHLLKAALIQPTKPGAVVIVVTSGAGLAGSPISGGYAGAKRMQMFLAGYAQKEAQRAGRDTRFFGLMPKTIMTQTAFGRAAVDAYLARLGINEATFFSGPDARQTPEQVAEAALALVTNPASYEGVNYIAGATGITPLV